MTRPWCTFHLAFPVFVLILVIAAFGPATALAEESVLWPGEVRGSILLQADAVAAPLEQGLLDGPALPVGAAVEGRSALSAPQRLGGSAGATDPVSSGGTAPTSWSALYRLVVPPRGGPVEVRARVRFANGAEMDAGPALSACLPLCTFSGGVLADGGCDPSCADCPLPCDPAPVFEGTDLAADVAFVRLRFVHACEGVAINPTKGWLRAWEDDGDGLLGPADIERARIEVTNPDTGPGTELLLPVPAGVALLLSGRAVLGTRAVDLSLLADPRSGGPLVLQSGEQLPVTIGPLAGATLPPGYVPGGGKECQEPRLGLVSGRFDLRDDPARDDTTLLALDLEVSEGPSQGSFAVTVPNGIPPGGIPPAVSPQVDRWELQGLLPNLDLPNELAELDGMRYATSAFRFDLHPAPGGASEGLPLLRGTVGGFEGAVALLSNDPPFDPAACGLDPGDPAVAVVAGLAPLVELYATTSPLPGLESLNTPAHRACAPEGGNLAIAARGPAAYLTEAPAFATTLRPARVEGVFRIHDGRLTPDGLIEEMGVERALVLESFERGPTTSLLSVGAAGLLFETTEGTRTESVSAILDVAGLRPPDLDDLRLFYGTPGLLDPAGLTEADLAARGVDPLPDLSIPDNRRALDASETVLVHSQPVALALNVPGPVTTRSYTLVFSGRDLESPLDDGRVDVEGRLRILDVTKPAHRSGRLRPADVHGGFAPGFPGADFPAPAFPLTLLEDAEGYPAGTVLDTAVSGSDLFLDPAISDGSFRFGTAYANDGPDTTVDTEPTPDPDPDDNDAILDPSVPRDPVLAKPDDDLSTRSRLLDRLTLEPEEITVENFGACFGALRVVLRGKAGFRVREAWVTGRGHLNTVGATSGLASLRPDLGVDLNEDGVEDQEIVLFDGPDEGFRSAPSNPGLGHAVRSVVLFLPAGRHLLEPHAVVREGPTGDERIADFPPLEVAVGCGEAALVAPGGRACPLTQGFWKRQCQGPHPSGEYEKLPDYVDIVNDLATFAGVTDVATLCDRLHPDPESDKCEQAEAQFLAAACNVASGRVEGDAVIEPGASGGPQPQAETADELLAEIDALLSDPARDFDACQLAQSLAAAFNERLLTPASAACDGAVADLSAPGGERAEGEGPPPPVDNSVRVWKTPAGLAIRWNDLPPSQAGSYEIVGHEGRPGLPPAEWVMDDLAAVLASAASGELGVELPCPPGHLVFFKVRGLSPTLAIPGPTRERGR